MRLWPLKNYTWTITRILDVSHWFNFAFYRRVHFTHWRKTSKLPITWFPTILVGWINPSSGRMGFIPETTDKFMNDFKPSQFKAWTWKMTTQVERLWPLRDFAGPSSYLMPGSRHKFIFFTVSIFFPVARTSHKALVRFYIRLRTNIEARRWNITYRKSRLRPSYE